MELSQIINFLDTKIKGCESLGGMEKEKWAFIQCKKFISGSSETQAVRQNEQTQEDCEDRNEHCTDDVDGLCRDCWISKNPI